MDEAWDWLVEINPAPPQQATTASNVAANTQNDTKPQSSAQRPPAYVWPAEVRYAKRSDWSGLSEAEIALHDHARLPGVQVQPLLSLLNTYPNTSTVGTSESCMARQ
eukprot:3709219-Rhodomonas_salina.2